MNKVAWCGCMGAWTSNLKANNLPNHPNLGKVLCVATLDHGANQPGNNCQIYIHNVSILTVCTGYSGTFAASDSSGGVQH